MQSHTPEAAAPVALLESIIESVPVGCAVVDRELRLTAHERGARRPHRPVELGAPRGAGHRGVRRARARHAQPVPPRDGHAHADRRHVRRRRRPGPSHRLPPAPGRKRRFVRGPLDRRLRRDRAPRPERERGSLPVGRRGDGGGRDPGRRRGADHRVQRQRGAHPRTRPRRDHRQGARRQPAARPCGRTARRSRPTSCPPSTRCGRAARTTTSSAASARPDGRMVWISLNSQPLLAAGETRPHGVALSFTDVTERQTAERLAMSEMRLLEMVATETPLTAILRRLALLVEDHCPGAVCAIMRVSDDGESLHPLAAPSLPVEYLAAIDGVSRRSPGRVVRDCGAPSRAGLRRRHRDGSPVGGACRARPRAGASSLLVGAGARRRTEASRRRSRSTSPSRARRPRQTSA